MEIRDVIGQLRADYLELGRRINECKLAIALIEYRLDKLETPTAARESAPSTKESDHGTQLSISEAPLHPATTETSLGKIRKRREPAPRRDPGASPTS